MSDIYKVSIALTGKQISVLRSVVHSGMYATTSEVIREAVREWQKNHHLLKVRPSRKASKRKTKKSRPPKRHKTHKRKRKL